MIKPSNPMGRLDTNCPSCYGRPASDSQCPDCGAIGPETTHEIVWFAGAEVDQPLCPACDRRHGGGCPAHSVGDVYEDRDIEGDSEAYDWWRAQQR